jgi:6-phosphogluconolactonase
MRGEDDPDDAADAYQKEIAACFGVSPGGPPPSFDLILLGLGLDGHTASLFPGSPALAESRKWVAAADGVPPVVRRITMTFPLLNAARKVVFLVTGEEKAEIVREVLEGPERYPAQRVRPTRGALSWILDAGAAALLTNSQRGRP